MAQLTFTPPFKIDNASQFKEALEVIHDELHKVTKNITYLDAYNITDVVVDSAKFNAQIAALEINSALVINSQPFFYNGVSYNTGDVILKMNSGETVHIKAQPGGIFYPSKISRDSNGNYSISYTYSKAAPVDGTQKTTTVGTDITNPYETISFTNLSASDVNSSYVYGVWASLKNLDLPIYYFNNSEITPQIQFWLVKKENETITPIEELSIEYTLTKSNSKWLIVIDSALNTLINDNLIWVKVK